MTDSKQIQFKQFKEKVLKKYPTAKTMKCQITQRYFVADEKGDKIRPFNMQIEDSETVYEAWRILSESFNLKWIDKNIIGRNTEYFSSNKIKAYADKMMKQS